MAKYRSFSQTTRQSRLVRTPLSDALDERQVAGNRKAKRFFMIADARPRSSMKQYYLTYRMEIYAAGIVIAAAFWFSFDLPAHITSISFIFELSSSASENIAIQFSAENEAAVGRLLSLGVNRSPSPTS
jgi:hypothetical protein